MHPFRTPLISILLAALPAPALALDWHLAAGAVDALEDRGPAAGGQSPEGDTGWTLAAGFRHDSGFGAELALVDLGSLEVSGIADAGYEVDGELWSLGATYAPDTGALQPYAKLGWFTRSEDGSALTIAGPRPFDLDDNGAMAEVGGRWRIGERLGLRLGYAWYDFDSGSDGSVQALAELHF